MVTGAIVRVVSRKLLREFWEQPGRQDSEQPLKTWFNVARKAEWRNFAEVKADLPSADLAHSRYVFDIKGNTYRLVCSIDFVRHGVLVLWVGTHREYDELMRHSGRKFMQRFGDAP